MNSLQPEYMNKTVGYAIKTKFLHIAKLLFEFLNTFSFRLLDLFKSIFNQSKEFTTKYFLSCKIFFSYFEVFFLIAGLFYLLFMINKKFQITTILGVSAPRSYYGFLDGITYGAITYVIKKLIKLNQDIFDSEFSRVYKEMFWSAFNKLRSYLTPGPNIGRMNRANSFIIKALKYLFLSFNLVASIFAICCLIHFIISLFSGALVEMSIFALFVNSMNYVMLNFLALLSSFYNLATIFVSKKN